MRQLIIARVITQPPYCFSSLSVDFSQRNYPTTILFRFLLISETTIRTVNRENAYFPIRRSVQIWYFRARAAGYLDVATISRHGTVHRHYTSLCARNRRTKECDSRDDRRKRERERRRRDKKENRANTYVSSPWCNNVVYYASLFFRDGTHVRQWNSRSFHFPSFPGTVVPGAPSRFYSSLSLSLSGENKMI